jgi:hypothetical protein
MFATETATVRFPSRTERPVRSIKNSTCFSPAQTEVRVRASVLLSLVEYRFVDSSVDWASKNRRTASLTMFSGPDG